MLCYTGQLEWLATKPSLAWFVWINQHFNLKNDLGPVIQCLQTPAWLLLCFCSEATLLGRLFIPACIFLLPCLGLCYLYRSMVLQYEALLASAKIAWYTTENRKAMSHMQPEQLIPFRRQSRSTKLVLWSQSLLKKEYMQLEQRVDQIVHRDRDSPLPIMSQLVS